MAEYIYQMVRARKAVGDKLILDDVTMSFLPGAKIGVVGPNGAGKSTLLAVLGATGHPTAGTVEVLRRRLGRVDVRELREHIGHVDPRHRMLSPLTVLETVLTGLTGTTDLM
ncbi:ATP-binding cassette domain-containing protein, partial [Pseudomonas viridiflava]|uniref:ATP-binding cassette domain-containing protein n=1 Tax=Pseudomonas viridiflava TaxID=33069 RepID=UPI0019D2A01C